MRLLIALCGLAFILTSCGGTGTSPTTPAATDSTSAAVRAPGLGPDEQIVGLWSLHVDRAGIASLTPRPDRAVQGTQSREFDLDISKFLKGDALRITDVDIDPATGDVLLGLAHHHPFPAPNFANPITALNRADLSYTGKLLILTDSVHVGFPGDSLSVDPTLIRLPDGYAATGDLLYEIGVTNNLFPYQLLVDEARDNRVGVSNGGNPKGNYDAANGGWQRGNAGALGDGWTGYDFIHGGQSVTSTLRLPKARVEAGPVDVDLAILVKYSDPRGTPNPNFRFPTQPANVISFAYRLPQAAFDVGHCTSCGDLQLLANPSSHSLIEVRVRDWDGSATEAADGDLSDETNPGLVIPGSTGPPTAEIHCPALSAAATPLTLDSGTGLPGDEYLYKGTLTNDLGTDTPGTYYALVEVTDPENSAPADATIHFGVDPNTLAASPTRRLPVRGYTVIPVTITGYNGWVSPVEPEHGSSAAGLAITPSGRVGVLMALAATTVDGDPGPCEDLRPGFGDTDMGFAFFDAEGNFESFNRIGGNRYDAPRSCAFDPTGAFLIGGRFTSDSVDFDPGPGVTEVSKGDTFAQGFLARYLPDGSLDRVITYGNGTGNQAEAWSIDFTDSGVLYMCGDIYGIDVDMDPTAGTDLFTTDRTDIFVTKLNANGTYGWTKTITTHGTDELFDSGRVVCATDNGEVVFGGGMEEPADLDPGPGVDDWAIGGLYNESYIVRLDAGGNYKWGRMWGSSYSDICWMVDEQSTGHIVAAGVWGGTVDFDTSPTGTDIHNSTGSTYQGYVTRYSGDGVWTKAVTWGNPVGGSATWSGSLGDDDSVVVSGDFTGTVDFDYGAGDHTKVSTLSDPYALRLNADLTFRWVEAVEGTDTGQGLKVVSAPGNTAIMLMSYFGMGETDVHPGAPVVPLPGEGTALVRYPAGGDW